MRWTLKINFCSVTDGKSWNANTESTLSENCHQSWRDSRRGGRGKYVVVATLFSKKGDEPWFILNVAQTWRQFSVHILYVPLSVVIIKLKILQLEPWKDDSENENLLCLKRNLKCPFSWLIIGRIANWDFYFTLFVSGLTLCINQRSARLDKVWENCVFYWRNI